MAHEERAHSSRSASKAPIYTKCHRAPQLWETLPEERKSSEASRLGTAKHTLAEMCQSTGMAAADFIGESITVEEQRYDIDEEFAQDVQTALDMAEEIIGDDDGVMYLEKRVSLASIVGPGESSLLDMAYWSNKRKLFVNVDFKFGRKPVKAPDNPSLLLYTSGILDELGLTDDEVREHKFLLVIAQPIQGTPSVWELTGEELLDELNQLRETCAKTYAEDAELVMGNHCFFCRAKPICPEMMQAVGSAVFDDPGFSDLDNPVEPDVHCPEQAAKIIKAMPSIKAWLEEFEEHWKRKWTEGADLPGLKLVEGKKGARQWKDKKAVEDLLASKFRIPAKEMYSQTLITPSAAEKLLAEKSPRRWAQLQEMVKQSNQKPSFVSESAAQPAMARSDNDNPFN